MPRTLRVFLLGVLVSLATAVLSLFATSMSASADDSGSGLLGAVGSTVNGVTDTAGDVVEPVTTAVVEPVANVTDVAGSGVVGAIVDPVVATAGSLPIVGPVVEQSGLGGVVTGVAGAVDETLPVVVGTAPEIAPVVPSLPGDGGEVLSPAPGVTAPPVTPPAAPLGHSDTGRT
ncbi:hypothetical protein [Microbacterium sp. VKM Ac-2923]|uniref:hypothetical protein n=1 Tax=Microbacterium sp. VKM Ac-2923 TaxID=2929476 RepID=UPI001FB538FC|nr:hypothetical protein [Microbacterium sp. VKM Ac-2923]MCJ1708496.1 hypothetical protein [Microbacterium sp. VKM Ac-2923]